MEKKQLLEIYDREQRIEVQFPGRRREVTPHVIRHIPSHGSDGFITYSHMNEQELEGEIRAQIDFYRELGMNFEWKVYDHDTPAGMREHLAAHGFTIDEPEALMVLDLQAAPDFYWSMTLPPIQHITSREGIFKIVAMLAEVWGEDHDDLGENLSRDLAEAPQLLDLFAIEVDDKIASAAWIYYHPPGPFASLWGGSTLPAFRQRGYYTALLTQRARFALQRGYRFLTVDASPMSQPILEKHGFELLGYSTPCNWRVSK